MELFSAFICANNIGSFVNGLFGVKTFNAFLSLSPFDNDVDGTTSMQILVLGLFTPWDIFGLESIIKHLLEQFHHLLRCHPIDLISWLCFAFIKFTIQSQ